MRSRSNQTGASPARSERTPAVAPSVLAACPFASKGTTVAARSLCSGTLARRLESSVIVASTDLVAFMGSTRGAAENGRIVPISQQSSLLDGYCLHTVQSGYRDRPLSPRKRAVLEAHFRTTPRRFVIGGRPLSCLCDQR